MSLTPEQLAMRRTGIGASEAAGLCGAHPYIVPISVYASKIGALPDLRNIPSYHRERGTLGEPFLIRWSAMRFGWCIQFPGTLRHPDRPLILATPDGVIDDSVLLEIKYPENDQHWWQDGELVVPFYHQIQCIQGMAVTGLRRCFLVAKLRGDIVRFDVEWDAEIAEMVMDAAERFWRRHVVPQRPPPPDGTESWRQYLHYTEDKELTPLADDSSPAMQAQIAKVLRLDAESKAAALAHEQAKQELALQIGEREGVVCKLPDGVYWRAQRRLEAARKNTDWAGVREELQISGHVIERNTKRADPRRVLRMLKGKGKTK